MPRSPRGFRLFGLVLVACLIACSQPEPDAIDSEGQAFHLADFKGKWVVINYWAEWCYACLKEIPDLDQLQRKYPEDVVVLGVNYDHRSNEYLRDFIGKYHITYRMTNDLQPNHMGLEAFATVPTTVVLDKSGKVVQVIRQPKTLAQFENILNF